MTRLAEQPPSHVTTGVVDARDLNAVIELAAPDLLAWRGARIMVTGATGFVGSWLMQAIVEANRQLDLGIELVAIARNPGRLPAHVGASALVSAIAADVRDLGVRDAGRFGHLDALVHLACASSAPDGSLDHDPRQRSATIVDGTRAVLRLAARSGRIRALVASSGAVHGRGSDRPARIAEDWPGAPVPGSRAEAYGLAKRLMECETEAAVAAGEIDATIARLWAFVGPLLPLDIHYAAGNFVADTIAGRPILVNGDPRTVRSYLYPVDLVCWLLAALRRGRAGVAYNIGSDVETTIGELASTISRVSGSTAGVRFAATQHSPGTQPIDRYVPDTTRARNEFGVRQTIGLDDAIERTLRWHRPQQLPSPAGDRL